MAAKFNLGGLEKRARGAMESALVVIGNEAKNHFTQSFRDGGFTDETVQKWTPRKKAGKRAGRAVLVDSGDLRRSIHRKSMSRSALSIIIATDLPYAAVHNFGRRAGRGSGFMMPKRQFIGDSRQLNKRIEAIIVKRLDNIFKK